MQDNKLSPESQEAFSELTKKGYFRAAIQEVDMRSQNRHIALDGAFRYAALTKSYHLGADDIIVIASKFAAYLNDE